MAQLSLSGWLERLESQHPVQIDLGLERVATVAHSLNLLTGPPPTITVAGTNGKGSVVAVATAALECAGLRVGRYISPHLSRFTERICIGGAEVQEDDLITAFEVIDQARCEISLTYFEVATLAGLWLFRQKEVDAQVLEVGLGGRLDAVNIIDADVSVVTSIGLDHTDWLGDSREQIAVEKAGIARSDRLCVVADSDPPDSLLATLRLHGATACLVNRDWHVAKKKIITASGSVYRMPHSRGLLPMNVGAAIQAVESSGLCTLEQSLIDQLSEVSLLGRLSRIRVDGLEVVLDVAHNLEAVVQLLRFLDDNPCSGKTVALFGVMGDKPIHDMLMRCESVFDEWNLIDLSHVPRAMCTDTLTELLKPIGQVADRGPFAEIWHSVRERSLAGDRIVVFGSFFSVGQAASLLTAHLHGGKSE